MGSGWIGMSGGSIGGGCEIAGLLPRIYTLTPGYSPADGPRSVSDYASSRAMFFLLPERPRVTSKRAATVAVSLILLPLLQPLATHFLPPRDLLPCHAFCEEVFAASGFLVALCAC